MASVESPQPSLSTIQREVSVVLRAAEDPAILTFKQVRVAVEKALGLKEGCLHKDHKATIREAVHSAMDKIESENVAKSSSPPPRNAEPEPEETAATSTLKNASRGKKWNTRSAKKIKFEDPEEANGGRGNTSPIQGKTENERQQRGSAKKKEPKREPEPEPKPEPELDWRTVVGKKETERQRGAEKKTQPKPEPGRRLVKTENGTERQPGGGGAKKNEPEPGRMLVKAKNETERQRGGNAKRNEPESEGRRTLKGKNMEVGSSGSSGSRGSGGGGGGGGADRKGPDDVVCVLGNTKTAKKQVSVNRWRGNIRVDIREYYTKDTGEFAPGLKGVSLNPSQWESLKDAAGLVDDMVDALT